MAVGAVQRMATKDISDHQVCRVYREMEADGGPARADARLQALTGQPIKVCWRAMERAERRGLVHYGVCLRSGWLTDEGRATLQEQGS